MECRKNKHLKFRKFSRLSQVSLSLSILYILNLSRKIENEKIIISRYNKTNIIKNETLISVKDFIIEKNNETIKSTTATTVETKKKTNEIKTINQSFKQTNITAEYNETIKNTKKRENYHRNNRKDKKEDKE